MTDQPMKNSEIWKGARRGTGWALGVATVVSVATILRDGPREGLKTMMRAGLSGRDTAAEVFEQVQDLYAEARFEHTADTHHDA